MELKTDTYLQGGKYRIVRSIGQGGFGITYLAEHVSLRTLVCIKEFFAKQLCSRVDNDSVAPISAGQSKLMSRFKYRFLTAARTIADLDHPNIIHIFDIFEENGTVYYVMEYIEGESLMSRVRREGPLTEEDALRYIRSVATSLGYLHDRNMLHLDIKPDNIMLRKEDDSIVLIDFGLAKHYDPETGKQTTIYIGAPTPGYSPFEQSLNGGGVIEFNAATDIYSLGATLFTLVTGAVPPEAALIPKEGLPLLPASLCSSTRAAIEKAMTYSIKRRPQSIAEFLALLNADNVTADTVSVETELEQKPVPEPKVEPKPTPKPKSLWEQLCDLGFKMIDIEGGAFCMYHEKRLFSSDLWYNVNLSDYAISETPITQAQWEAVMGTTISQQRDLEDASLWLYGVGPNNPMYYVSYEEAMEFCRRLSSATGKRYTLPTEAQWEFAARGGNKSKGYEYSGSNAIHEVAWYDKNSNSTKHPVKLKRPNELGLYDMSGNVWEWCLDWYGAYPLSKDGHYVLNPQGPSSGKYRVIRGGSWFSNASFCRVAYRGSGHPSNRLKNLGFRVVCLP